MVTPNQQAIVDSLVAEFTKINEQANDGPVIDLCAFRARFSIDMQKHDEAIAKKRVILETKIAMAKADFERLEKDFAGTGIRVNYCNDARANVAPYLTISDKCGGQLRHLIYTEVVGVGLIYRDFYVGNCDTLRRLTLAEIMGDKRVIDIIYQMYSWNQRN
jgi:hypothetical protein